MEGLLLALVAAAVVVAIALLHHADRLRRRRLQELADLAPRLGLAYAPEESYRCLALPFSLLRSGDDRGAENLIHGTWNGLAVRVFDYWYEVESRNADGVTTTTTYRFSCAVTDVEAAMPPLVVRRETTMTRLADSIGLPDVQLELEEFNRAFTVKSEDRKFANDFCDQRMMRWLMGTHRATSFEVCRGWLLVYAKRLAPRELIPLLETLRQFRERIPPVVYELYGPSTSG